MSHIMEDVEANAYHNNRFSHRSNDCYWVISSVYTMASGRPITS